MKRKKALKAICLIIITALILTGFYNLFSYFTKGNLRINVKTSSTYYSGGNVDVLVDVSNEESEKSVDSKVKLELYDSNGKKVKKTKTSKKVSKNIQEDISLNLPENLEEGSYDLKITARSGIFNDSLDVPVNIAKDEKAKTVISLDKGIYKPGDQINYRALILSNKDYKPEEQEVSIFIYDGNENKVYSETAKTSEYGIVSGSFNLGDEVNSGTYKIVVSNKSQEFSKTFTVNPYITPKFEASISTNKESYLVGETAQITISGKYFFGEPVANANVKGKINDKEIIGITNNEGNFVTTYNISQKGSLNLEFEVIDTSNYAVEASKKVSCGTDIFEIEILPEYGEIVKGIDNIIYIITKTAGGEAVKTYSDISIANISKQVITDENGIGCFTLTSDDTASLKSNIENSINIICKDMNENKITKDEKISVIQNQGTLVKTDKVKYLAGDDINVSLEANSNFNNNVIYVYKNNELLKILSSDTSEFSFNLNEVTGLIDIYTPANNNSYTNYYGGNIIRETNTTSNIITTTKNRKSNNGKYNKKTIFIKPDKALNINIETNSEEYKPGENLNIKFSTTNQNNQTVDSALLVSILDEAILKLAENDLSIDNIKLALQDIELADGMTAADLYANVLDDSSDVLLNAVMLKQTFSEPKILSKSYVNYDKYDYFERAVIIGAILLAIFFTYLILKSEKFRKIIKPTIDVIIITIIILLYLEEFLSYELRFPELLTFFTCLVISIVAYVLILYKESDYILKLSLELLLIPGIVFGISGLLVDILYYGLPSTIKGVVPFVPIILGLIIVLIYAITKSKSKTQELTRFENVLHILSKMVIKAFLFWFAMTIVSELLGTISFLIVLVIYILFDRVILKEHKEKPIKDGKIVLEITGLDTISMSIGIVMIIVILMFCMFIYNSRHFASTVNDSMTSMSTSDMDDFSWNDATSAKDSFSSTSSFMYESKFDSITTDSNSNEIIDRITSASKSNGITDTISSLFDNKKSETINDSTEIALEENIDNLQSEDNLNEQVEENVRNVFLESLAFIPELVTENGKAETNLEISDNITTWNIQTIGNTKDGNIGYSSSSFKVFKEFFVDFSLPNNCVVTDKISIPVTLYNYTDGDLNIDINVVANDWSNIGEYAKSVNVPQQSTAMIYIPLEIIKQGNNTLRVETKAGNISDIVEKTLTVKLNGLEKEEVVSSGTIEKKYTQDMIFEDEAIEGSGKVKVKLYTTPISQAVEGIESMLKLPTGCFEQTSSSLYPDILVLKYLKNNNLNNETIEKKALEYISTGYQKLLTYEVSGEKGGYSLYGNSPAEPVITAFGLMEFNELKEVYNIDENVIKNMTEYLFKEQKSDGTFNYKSTYIGSAETTDKYAMNAYIAWALSEVCPEDVRLEKSIKYFEKNIDKIADNYTLALIANIFANTDNKDDAKDIINELTNKLNISDNSVYLSSSICDYYGTTGKYQNVQTSSLLSIALSKLNTDNKNNNLLVNYLVNSKKPSGTWGTTQSTILALKAINDYSSSSDISNQTITVQFNDQEKKVDIDKNTLDYYEFEFENVSKENKVSIDMKKGKISYEIIKEYYEEYSKIKNEYDISVNQVINTNVKVNDIITQTINITNNQKNIANGLIEIMIPQGTTPIEDTLLKLKYDGIIEKYEYNYGKINIYVRDFENSDTLSFNIQYKALYPVDITGASIRFYDYYNPEVESITLPVNMNVSE